MDFRRRVAPAAALAVVALLAIGACGGGGTNAPAQKKIGLAISTLNNPFFVTLRDGAQKAATAGGVQLTVTDGANDNAKQADQISTFITQKVDVIIVNPTDSDAVVSSVQKANTAKIPVIAVDRNSNGGTLASYIASNNVQAGKLGGQQLLKAVPANAKVAMLIGIPGASAARDRGKGFLDAVADTSINTKGAKVVAQQVANFKRDEALNVMQNILTANPDLAGVFAQNDEMALGAVQAIKAKGLTGKVFVVGVDGVDDAKTAIKAGDMLATVAQQPDVMGQLAVEAAIKLTKGQTVDSKQDVPLKVLTKDNV
jgi:ribose transport system substrate-binding protein